MKREVLISPGIGAGWSSWNLDFAEFLLFDKTLIQMAKDKASSEEVEKYLKSKGLDEYEIYTGGWCNIKVVEVDEPFIIKEYDGSESIVLKSEIKFYNED